MKGISMGALALAITAVTGAAHATDYSADGASTYTSGALTPSGGASGGYLVVPDGAGPFPFIVASHGWSAAADNQLGWAEHFASYGFVVAVPSFPNTLTPDAKIDSGIIEQLVVLYTDPSTMSAAQGKVDPKHVGLEGHSAGGLATTLASASLKPQATVFFDPVDDSAGDGKVAYATLCAPVLGLFADPSSCNNSSGWSAFESTAIGPLVTANVVGSTHCDGENAPRALCGPFCGGGADPSRQAVYAHYATAFFLAHLKGDATAAAELTSATMDADSRVAKVAVTSAADCSEPISTPDAGGPEADAGVPPKADAGRPAGGDDAGQLAPDAGPGAGEGDAPVYASSGCACDVRSDRAAPPGLPLYGAAALVFGLARRRRHARG